MIEQFSERMLMQALDKNISDIYIIPVKDKYHIYFRYLNRLLLHKGVAIDYGERLLIYFKYISQMVVGEKRKPQSGAAQMHIRQKKFEIRTSTISNFKGKESMVIRLLKMTQNLTHLNHFFPQEINKLYQLLKKRQGLVLFSGPVDSGKTTLVHYLLQRKYKEKALNVLTIEDPVEITDERFLQTEINEIAGIDYDTLIKASLRHHPDIIVIGEIRDSVTAKMAVRAALTGHLVIATIHAKSCRGVVERLRDLSVSDRLISETVTGIVSQRLLPQYCGLCQNTCQLFCQHIQSQQKRLVLTDIKTTKQLKDYFKSSHYIEGFNQQLNKAYLAQYISKDIMEEYWIDV